MKKFKIRLKPTFQLAIVVVLLTSAFLLLKYIKFKADVNDIVTPELLSPVDNFRYVYSNNPLIQGTATAGSKINIFLDNISVGSTFTDDDGHFYFKPEAFSDGVHSIGAVDETNNKQSIKIHVSFEGGDQSKAILRANGTEIMENDHPFYGNGENKFDAIVKTMGKPDVVESDFAKAEKAGIRMIRVINYMLDDMKLPDPPTSPAVVVSGGGALAEGSYVYRYSCINLSKDSFSYNTAETLPSPSSAPVLIGANQKAVLTLNPCAQSYRYLIYRRNAADAEGSEALLGFAQAPAGQPTTFSDDGSYVTSDNIANPTVAPTLAAEKAAAPSEALPAGTYFYRYTKHTARKPGDGRGETLAAGGQTLAGPTSEITVDGTETVKVTIQGANQGTWLSIYRRKSTDAADSEKNILSPRSSAGDTVVYNKNTTPANINIPGTNTTVKVSPAATNNTKNNQRTTWPTDQSKAFMTGLNNWNEDALVAADKTLALAKKYNIRIMFTFVDQHDNNTGGVREITRNCGVPNAAFFYDACAKNEMKTIIDKFLDRTNTETGLLYKNDPSIFAWEFINEPYETASGSTFRGWIGEMASYVKSKDPRHLVASGDDGSIWFTHNAEGAYNFNNNHDFVMEGIDKNIDLLTWHGYPESTGFMFNHGYYGEFKPDPVNDKEWLDKYGPVVGPIDIDKTIQQMQLHAHYASLLNKPIVFGEWGVNWNGSGAKDWITRISDAILTVKPDLKRGANAFSDGNFTKDPALSWSVSSNTADLSIDTADQYNGHSTLKLTPRPYIGGDGQTHFYSGATTKRIPVKPNTHYWYEFTVKNSTDKNLRISIPSYYKNGQKVGDFPWGYGFDFSNTNGTWVTADRFKNGLCEFTTPDADEVEISANLFNPTNSAPVFIGEINLYELINTPEAAPGFAATGWWGLPDDNPDITSALAEAQKKFDQKSIEGLPLIYIKGQPPLPIVKNERKMTYKATVDLEISKAENIEKILINGSSENVINTGNLWKKTVDLSLGPNTIKVTGVDADDQSADIYYEISRHKPADANNDSKVDIRDFSLLLVNWSKILFSTSQSADLNEDDKVDIKDFSALMANWGR